MKHWEPTFAGVKKEKIHTIDYYSTLIEGKIHRASIYGFSTDFRIKYHENDIGFWTLSKFDKYKNIIYFKNSYGDIERWKYDKNGKEIYHKTNKK